MQGQTLQPRDDTNCNISNSVSESHIKDLDLICVESWCTGDLNIEAPKIVPLVKVASKTSGSQKRKNK